MATNDAVANTSTGKDESVRVDDYSREILEQLSEAHKRLKNVVDKGKGAFSVRVTTAVPLDDELRAKVLAKARDLFKSDVYLNEIVDPSILGGIILEAPTGRFDASVRAQLANVRRSLAATKTGEDA